MKSRGRRIMGRVVEIAMEGVAMVWVLFRRWNNAFRHSGERPESLVFVIPAKAGIHSYPSFRRGPSICWLVVFGLGRFAKTTHVHVHFVRHPWRPVHFLLLAQESNQKRHPRIRAARAASGSLRADGFGHRPSGLWAKIHRAARALRGFSIRPSPLLRGDPRARATWIPAFAGMTGFGGAAYAASSLNGVVICGGTSPLASAAGTALPAPPCPLGPLSAAAKKMWSRSVAKRWPAGGRPGGTGRTKGHVLPGGGPGPCSRSHARMDARVTSQTRGVSFSWFHFSLDKPKRSNRKP